VESLEILNRRLERFGKYLDGRPNYRIVFSYDEMEKRFGTFEDRTSEGLFIREVTEVREVPKYRQYINPSAFILEKLLEVPFFQQDQILLKTSYEPVWVFWDRFQNPIYPTWQGIELIINTIHKNMEGKNPRKSDPREILRDPETYKESYREQVNSLVFELFGNETDTTDALAYKEGIVVPANYTKEN
jgi:hypothetical protein